MPKWTEEQQLAIDKDNTNIIVSAGAGSGKTTVLTARVIRKLKSNININQLLILTFTKKAAFGMKEKIREAIKKDDSLREQLNYLDNSYITTFDSFALSVVKKYNYLLNVGKNVKIADSSIIYLEKVKILDEIFERLYEEEDQEFLNLISNFTIKDDKEIKKCILEINNKVDLKYDKIDYLSNYVSNYYNRSNIDELVSKYTSFIKEKIDALDSLLTDFSYLVDSLYFKDFYELFKPLLEGLTYEEIKENVNIKLPSLPKGSSDEASKVKEKIKNSLEKITELVRFSDTKDLINTFLSTKDYVSCITKIIIELDNSLNAFKDKNNIYEFSDISKMAIKIVKENPTVREELKNSFKEIMIDEYQDTSDLQEEFISMIQNNNVYMVGDIKQSIYRFRNANPYLFKSKYDNFANNNGGFKIDLTKNFRSRSEVIFDINTLFSLVMSDKVGGADYKKNHLMIFGNDNYNTIGKNNSDNKLEIFNYEYDKDSLYKKCEIEAFYIARDIKNKVKNKYQIFDKDLNSMRDAEYRDFTILLDKSLNFDLYKKIFEYLEIPMVKMTTNNITVEIEIVLIKNILKLIIDFKDKNFATEFKYAFISIARSYLFRYDDDTIAGYVLNNNYSDSSIMKIISEITDVFQYVSLSELIEMIISKFSFYEKQIEVGDIKNSSNRISSIIEIFNNFSDVGYTIYDAYEYLNTIIEDSYKLEVKSLESSKNSVSIMTIHTSKGLEFPVCYFASFDSLFNIRELNEKFLYNEKYGIIAPYFKEGIGKTFIKDLVRDDYISEEISEKIRLLYVALTRAKEKMIIVTSFPEKHEVSSLKESRSFLDILIYMKNDIKDYIKNISIKDIGLTKDYNSIKKYNYQDSIEKSLDEINVSLVPIEKEYVKSTRISKETSTLLDESVKNNIEFGKKMHRILEFIDFKNPNIDNLDISPLYKKNIKKLIDLVSRKDLMSVYKEYEFIYEEDNVYKHGIIDLLLEYEDNIKIIDYKLKNITDSAYYNQLENYRSYISLKINKKIDIYLFSIVDGNITKIEENISL